VKILPNILFLIFIGLNSSFGQNINALLIRQTLSGQVIIEVAPLDYLMTHNTKKPKVDSSKTVKCIEYKIKASGDTAYFNFFKYPYRSTYVYTSQGAGIAPLHFPETIENKLRTIDSKTIELTDFYWSGSYGHEQPKPHILKLRYNKKGQLIKIFETRKGDSDKITSYIWKYKYKHNLLRSIAVGEVKSIYEYDADRNIISTIRYSGKIAMNSTYLCFDSLADLYSKKKDHYQLSQLLNNQDSKILQLAFYKYSKGKLIGMACYDSNYGIQITTIVYDSLQRISSFKAERRFFGSKIEYSYEQNSNRLLERSESNCSSSSCYKTGITYMYTYNENGMIDNIQQKTYELNSDGSKKAESDTGGEKFEY